MINNRVHKGMKQGKHVITSYPNQESTFTMDKDTDTDTTNQEWKTEVIMSSSKYQNANTLRVPLKSKRSFCIRLHPPAKRSLQIWVSLNM